MHFLFLSKVPINEPLPVSPTGPLGRDLAVYRDFFFTYLSNSLIKMSPKINKIFPSLKGPRKEVLILVPPKRVPYGNRRPFPEPYLAYLSRSPVKEPSLQVPTIQRPQREMPHS
jgi:hypothetical protein